uniref:Uncharacterized protein n=1 Tax=Monodelphis domestica TaxID=13616 RepID=A0A5F8HF21_MONDO
YRTEGVRRWEEGQESELSTSKLEMRQGRKQESNLQQAAGNRDAKRMLAGSWQLRGMPQELGVAMAAPAQLLQVPLQDVREKVAGAELHRVPAQRLADLRHRHPQQRPRVALAHPAPRTPAPPPSSPLPYSSSCFQTQRASWAIIRGSSPPPPRRGNRFPDSRRLSQSFSSAGRASLRAAILDSPRLRLGASRKKNPTLTIVPCHLLFHFAKETKTTSGRAWFLTRLGLKLPDFICIWLLNSWHSACPMNTLNYVWHIHFFPISKKHSSLLSLPTSPIRTHTPPMYTL